MFIGCESSNILAPEDNNENINQIDEELLCDTVYITDDVTIEATLVSDYYDILITNTSNDTLGYQGNGIYISYWIYNWYGESCGDYPGPVFQYVSDVINPNTTIQVNGYFPNDCFDEEYTNMNSLLLRYEICID